MTTDCAICKRDSEAVVLYYSDYPFVDGRKYNIICFTCASVPKHYGLVDGEWVRLYNTLYTAKEMQDQGWDIKDAEISIRAIKRALKKDKLIVVADGPNHIFDVLYLEDEPLTV